MQKILKKINSDEILNEAAELLKAAFSNQNMATKYRLYQEANDLKYIAKKLYKYEEMQRRGDI